MNNKICCQWLVPARNLQIIENFLTLESSQYHKSGSTFSSSKPVTACSNCSRFGNTLLAHLTSRTCACQRAWPLILKSKTSIFFWNSLWEWLPDDRQGLDLGLKLEICSLSDCHMTSLTCRGPNLDSTWTLLSDQRIVKLLSAWNNSLHKLCGVWILFRSFEDADIAKVTFSSDSARQMAFCCLWLRSRTRAHNRLSATELLLDLRACLSESSSFSCIIPQPTTSTESCSQQKSNEICTWTRFLILALLPESKLLFAASDCWNVKGRPDCRQKSRGLF